MAGLDTNMLNLIKYLAKNQIQNAKTAALACLANDKTKTDIPQSRDGRWQMAEELKENYTIYVDGEKKNKDFNIDGLSHAKYGIEINIDKKAIYFYHDHVENTPTS